MFYTLKKLLLFTVCMCALAGPSAVGANSSATPNEVQYTIHGNGVQKVLVLHSWMDDYESWKPVIPYLDLKSHTYAFIDVRGYGRSKHVKGSYTADEIVQDIFTVADELGWDKFSLVGHSMTGMVVQKAALLDDKKRIKKVIAITPVSSAGFAVDEENLKFFESIVQSREVSNQAFRAFTSNRLSETWYLNRAARHVEVTNPKAQQAYINMWTSENFSDKMPQVTTPFLVLAGQYDHPAFQLSTQKIAFANIQQVDFQEIENSGHFPMQETPIYLASKIEAFLQEAE